jgi:cell division protein FtsN
LPALGLILLAALAIGVTWWLTTPISSGSGERSTAEPPAATAGPPAIDPASVRHLPYSVQVESYSALADALDRQRQLASVGAPVFIAPAAVEDVLYFRVFAGLASDPDSAHALLRRLVQRGVKDSVLVSDVRTLPWAFDIGLFADRESAERRRRELVELGIPSYIVDVPTTAGIGLRLYVGGYENATEAQVMATTLERNGIRVPLVPRIGS